MAKPATHFVEVYDEKGMTISANVGTVKGSPLWRDEWCNANVEMFNGKKFSNLPLIINLVNGHIHFKQGDAEFQFVDAIQKMTLFYQEEGVADSITLIKLSPDNSILYEVKKTSAKYQLLQMINKKAVDTYDYGKSSGGKQFELFKENFLLRVSSRELVSVKGKSVAELFTTDAEAAIQILPAAKKRKQLSVQDISTIIAGL
ncbi:hypothetical protein [Sediminibacterium salmoneum]|uniref:hypothetical protein n=1 Tax=Sediminibacterium salmoneum TaxID=426421 RepID=UPI0012FB17B7|nr:hypothetical protein [Sediminibacterium salmoneum]